MDHQDVGKDLAGVRVLVVEDTVIVAIELERLLLLMGCEVVGPFHSLHSAQAWVESDRDVDIAIMDVNLSGEEIFPVADEMAERGVPYALMTGYMRDFLPPRYSQRPLLEKPFSRAQLRDIVHELVHSATTR